jgi:hypothetical protein
MTFVTKKIDEVDVKEYGLGKFNQHFGTDIMGKLTIDRERNIWLRLVRYDLSSPGAVRYLFSWKNLNIDITLIFSPGEDDMSDTIAVEWGGMRFLGSEEQLNDVRKGRQTILCDFKEALISHSASSPNSQNIRYFFKF